jgi:large subunit ribosomal protein L35
LLYQPASSRLACKGHAMAAFYRFERISKMPKMKTKSSAKKRFKATATGKIKGAQVGKRHGMIKRTNKQIRNQRGTTVLAAGDTRHVKLHMPYIGK